VSFVRDTARPVHTPRSPGDALDLDGRLSGDLRALDDFARELGSSGQAGQARHAADFLSRRVNANPATVEKDLAKLVLALIDLLRQLMERQAARRVNAGSLSEDEVERMGETFLQLDRRMAELRTAFGLEGEDLNLSLGPIGDLL
jgi:hypothetical protein